MPFYYAQIDENNVCFAISELSSEMSDSNLIKINEFDIYLIGKTWDSKNWI